MRRRREMQWAARINNALEENRFDLYRMTIAPLQEAVPATAATAVAYDPLPVEEQVNIAIRFDFDSAVLRDDQKPRLAALCAVAYGLAGGG